MRYKVTLSYDGTNFKGFQIQPNVRTVQGDLERALTRMAKGQNIRIHPSGRTDAGVHAIGQVFHFDWPLTEISEEGMLKGLNVLTAADITIRSVQKVPLDFHARYQAKAKTYIYRVDQKSIQSPFDRLYAYHHPYTLDEEKIKRALSLIVGTHDFTSFCASETDKIDKVRTIYQTSLDIDHDQNIWTFTFEGNGFLYNMVRILMGTFIEIGDGRRSLDNFQETMKAKDRSKAAKTLAPHGLYLKSVKY